MCTQKANKKPPGSDIFFKRKEKGLFFSFSLRGRGNSISERRVVLFLKKENQYLWSPNRKLSFRWGLIKENQAVSGTEQGRYCAKLDNTLVFFNNSSG